MANVRCCLCKEDLPTSAFSAAMLAMTNRPDGRICMVCGNAQWQYVMLKSTSAKAETYRRNLLLAAEGKQHCGLCKRDLPFDAFALNNTNASGRQTRCKTCSYAAHNASRQRAKAAREAAARIDYTKGSRP